jgi:hypothetical protein
LEEGDQVHKQIIERCHCFPLEHHDKFEWRNAADRFKIPTIVRKHRGANLPTGERNQTVIHEPGALFHIISQASLHGREDGAGVTERFRSGSEQPSCSGKRVEEIVDRTDSGWSKRASAEFQEHDRTHVSKKRSR